LTYVITRPNKENSQRERFASIEQTPSFSLSDYELIEKLTISCVKDEIVEKVALIAKHKSKAAKKKPAKFNPKAK